MAVFYYIVVFMSCPCGAHGGLWPRFARPAFSALHPLIHHSFWWGGVLLPAPPTPFYTRLLVPSVGVSSLWLFVYPLLLSDLCHFAPQILLFGQASGGSGATLVFPLKVLVSFYKSARAFVF